MLSRGLSFCFSFFSASEWWCSAPTILIIKLSDCREDTESDVVSATDGATNPDLNVPCLPPSLTNNWCFN